MIETARQTDKLHNKEKKKVSSKENCGVYKSQNKEIYD